MFKADFISLSDGQSYENVLVCEDCDIDGYNIPKLFEQWTACVFVDNQCLIVHHWKIKVIKLSKNRITAPNAIHTTRLVLDGDIVYSPAILIHQDQWVNMEIPHFFVKRDGIAGQLVWTNSEGTFITHDTNVTSIVIPDPRKSGITQSETLLPKKISKETIHAKISKS